MKNKHVSANVKTNVANVENWLLEFCRVPSLFTIARCNTYMHKWTPWEIDQMFLSGAFVFPNIEDISYWSLTINEQEGKYTEYNRHTSGRVNTLNNNRIDMRGCSPLMSQSLKAALFYYYNKLQCKNVKGEVKRWKGK